MSTSAKVGFKDIEIHIPAEPGIYEIYTHDGEPLKVGISLNLRKRLRQHRESKQKYLRLKPGGDWGNPAHVESKRSILAKHLYFAESMKGFDLQTELGRQQFLLGECYILFRVTATKAESRELEKILEAEGRFRFAGRVAQIAGVHS